MTLAGQVPSLAKVLISQLDTDRYLLGGRGSLPFWLLFAGKVKPNEERAQPGTGTQNRGGAGEISRLGPGTFEAGGRSLHLFKVGL